MGEHRTHGAGTEDGGGSLTGAVGWAARRRVVARWRAAVVVGALLGLAFGLGLASFAAARRTASAYERIQVVAATADASIFHSLSAEDAQGAFGGIEGIESQHYIAGYSGTFDGIDPALTRGLLAFADGIFPERPLLSAGRLPDQAAVDEIYVNDHLAARADLHVGQQLEMNLFAPQSSEVVETLRVTIAGIGTMPSEVVVDEVAATGMVGLTRAFYEAHRDLIDYISTTVDLSPGVDAGRDLAPVLGAAGFELQASRAQGASTVNEALRPLGTLLVGLGLLGLVATILAAIQALLREQGWARAEDAGLRALGMTRVQVALVPLGWSAVLAATASAVALALMVLTSPIAPIGPLHRFDPAQGVSLDLTVAAVGVGTLWAMVGALTLLIALRRAPSAAGAPSHRPMSARRARRAPSLAGLALAWRGAGRPGRAWRSVVATTLAITLTAAIATVVAASISLSATPASYGFDWDLLAVSQFGDQTRAALDQAFGDDEDVVAVAGFTTGTLLIDGRAVPGLAVTSVKGTVLPSVLHGTTAVDPDEIVLGQDTLEDVGARLGDTVRVQIFTFEGEPAAAPVELEVVGVSTFPPVSEPGGDVARLGFGALVTRDAYRAMQGPADDDPEWTALRLADGVDPAAVIARHPAGIPDRYDTPTEWFTDAKPAELRQLDEVRPLLGGAVIAGYLIALVVVLQAMWSAASANRRPMGVLHALGFSRRQLAEVAAWLAVPPAAASLLVGVPLGVAAGRWGFSVYARSLAVADTASTPALTIGALVVATLVAAGLGAAGAVAVVRRLHTTAVLSEA